MQSFSASSSANKGQCEAFIVRGTPARRQDSVTGWAEINFRGALVVYFCEFEKGTGAREIYPSLDRKNKVKTKKKVFTEIQRDFPAEIRIWNGLFGQKQVTSEKKKVFIPKILCQTTKIKIFLWSSKEISVAFITFGLDLHSCCSEPVNFSEHSPRLGGTIFVWGVQALIWGGTAPECPPVAPTLVVDRWAGGSLTWRPKKSVRQTITSLTAYCGLQLRHSFFCQNDWTSKRDYKTLDVTINHCIIPSVGLFKEFDCKVLLLYIAWL